MTGKVLHQEPADGLVFISVQTQSDQPDAKCVLLIGVVDGLCLNPLLGDCHPVHSGTKFCVCTHLLLRQRTGKGQADFFCRDRDSSHAGVSGTQSVLFQLIQHLIHRAGGCLFQCVQKSLRHREVRAHRFVQQRAAAVHQVQEVADALGGVSRHRQADGQFVHILQSWLFGRNRCLIRIGVIHSIHRLILDHRFLNFRRFLGIFLSFPPDSGREKDTDDGSGAGLTF